MKAKLSVSYREFINALGKHFGSKQINRITAADVVEYQATRGKQAGAGRVNHEIGVLKRSRKEALGRNCC